MVKWLIASWTHSGNASMFSLMQSDFPASKSDYRIESRLMVYFVSAEEEINIICFQTRNIHKGNMT